MNSTDLKLIPAPPSLMKSLMAGFDAISKNLSLILFSITLDLVILFGPRVRITQIIERSLSDNGLVAELGDSQIFEILLDIIRTFNLLSVSRTFPVGIPSLMAGYSLVESPYGQPLTWELVSIESAGGIWLLFTLIGLIFGTLFFALVAQVCHEDQLKFRQVFIRFPWYFWQIMLLTLGWFGLLITIIFPFSCLISTFTLSGSGIGQLAIFGVIILGSIFVWLMIPLFFTPHGIFINHQTVWRSVRDSIRITRWTLPSTAIFLLSILILSKGLDLLWSVPDETSWFTLIGISGHAFIATSVLAASFIYYKDAFRWVEQLLMKAKESTSE